MLAWFQRGADGDIGGFRGHVRQRISQSGDQPFGAIVHHEAFDEQSPLLGGYVLLARSLSGDRNLIEPVRAAINRKPYHDQSNDLLHDALRQANAGVLIATHHTDEALRLADDIAVLIDGRMEQVDTAMQVYRHPVNLQVAQITGYASLFDGKVMRPEQLMFTPGDAGGAVIVTCEFHGAGHLLTVNHADSLIKVWHHEPLAEGVRGMITART